LAQIARDLRSGYTIGFAPRDTGESGYRSIRVVADAGDGRPLVVRTRTGYYATLITCCPFWLLGNAPERFVVRATRVRSAAAAPVAPTTPRFGMVDDPYGPHAAESAARELAVAQR
jgi:hypothetical protein